jgi:phenylpropionate dioxygenase-like ring-hydroxylating dioxygenase large terminal subunit
MTTTTRDQPFPAYPNSWHHLVFTHELGRGKVLSVRVLGRDLAVVRGDDGVARAFDATCPHLGADLGQGSMRDGRLVCPFHGWAFDADGQCAHVPYAHKPPKVRLGSYPVCEANGVVWIWQHDRGEAPTFAVPEVPAFRAPRRVLRSVRTVRSNLYHHNENLVDFAHFMAVHDTREVPQGTVTWDGATMHVSMQARVTWKGLPIEGQVEIDAHGSSINVVRSPKPAPFTFLVSMAPVDEHTVVEHLSAVFEPLFGVRLPVVDTLYQRTLMDELVAATDADHAILARRKFVARPVLAPGDGPIHRYSAWYRQFFSDEVPLDAPEAAPGEVGERA